MVYLIIDQSQLIYQFTIVLIFFVTVVFYLSMFFYSKRLTSSIIKQQETERELLESNFNLERVKIEKERVELTELAEKEKSQRLQEAMDMKAKQLVSNTLLISQQYDVLSKIDQEMQEIAKAATPKVRSSTSKIRRIIKSNLSIEENWKDFLLQFEQLHPDFFKSLKTKYPKLTQNDLRHCAFIKMRMNTKEIARMLNINPTSVQISRVRMKKKIGLPTEQDLKAFLQNY